VTEFGEDEHLLPDDGDRVVLAHLGAAAAIGAFLQIYLRDHLPHLATFLDGGPEEEGSVGFLHVAV
jgi:hypothetical protein